MMRARSPARDTDFASAEDLDGYEDLKEEDQERVAKAFEAGEGELGCPLLQVESR